jgi:hypothetical protein
MGFWQVRIIEGHAFQFERMPNRTVEKLLVFSMGKFGIIVVAHPARWLRLRAWREFSTCRRPTALFNPVRRAALSSTHWGTRLRKHSQYGSEFQSFCAPADGTGLPSLEGTGDFGTSRFYGQLPGQV